MGDNHRVNDQLWISTPTKCRPTDVAAHVLAMQPVFPGICQGQQK